MFKRKNAYHQHSNETQSQYKKSTFNQQKESD